MRWLVAAASAAVIISSTLGAASTLDIYFIDVEGGQSTLIVTPAGESLLVDAGFPGDGTFSSKPGDPQRARDARRIAGVAKAAGLSAIDYLLVTHFHADHDGGVVELSKLLPIRTFIDHGNINPETELNVKGSMAMLVAYAAVRAKAQRAEPKAGERLPLKGVDAVVVSTGGTTLTRPIAAAPATPGCAPAARPAQEPYENPRSTGFVMQYGRFRFLDVGDLTGQPLFSLTCPASLVGSVDVYLVAHHGGADASDAATFAAFRPRVAVLNNGAMKGGDPEMFEALRHAAGIEDVWQLHRSEKPGAANFDDERIANLSESTAHSIKLSAREDGSFQVTNGRTGQTKTYAAR